ncbi:MAG: hypothetical protein LUC85_01995 [Bacteroidales bacterium]|nr:hypothetical protein [Bacteroidales bacterium]MCD8393590.1 hypothetical protein [Bacteroidales bacterium]
MDKLKSTPCLAVNFAALAEDFIDIKPRYYVLADPHFFSSNERVKQLIDRLKNVDWKMTLFVPATSKHVPDFSGTRVKVERFNAVGVDAWPWLEKALMGRRLAMPRPRNVLIPSIMIALWLGYKKVLVAGADHSWMQSIWVNERNEVVSVQPHFYKEPEGEQKRVDSEYRGYRLHEIVHSFYVAFRAYHQIARFAKAIGSEVINVTPGSYIDAFPRSEL